jgi:dienelactone hydrolase
VSIQTQAIEYKDGETLLEGYLAYSDEGTKPKPTVLIAHAWEGRNSFVCDKARMLAELGYTAFALDMYGKGVLGSGPEENTALMQPLLEDRSVLQQRMKAGLLAASSLPQVDAQNIAVMGYCFGGLCALDLARTQPELKGVVSFHGLLNAPGNTDGNRIGAKVLILHGHLDPLVPVEQVVACQQELTNAGADWQIHIYGKALHSFTNPKATDASTGLFYNADADRRSWQELRNFLAEIFS